MLTLLDSWLNRITMYRLMLYYLIAIVAVAAGLSCLGILSYNPLGIVFLALYLSGLCWGVNKLLAWGFDAPTNSESALITALILSLIITPPHTFHDLLFPTLAGIIAMASKYLLTIRRAHIFNPAAIAVVITALIGLGTASWWVGTSVMLPVVLVGGFLVLRKIQRGWMVLTFFSVALAELALLSVWHHADIGLALKNAVLVSPLSFFALVMFTEPSTSPPTEILRLGFAAIAGILYSSGARIGAFYLTPELALVTVNALAYVVMPRFRLKLHFKSKNRLAPDIEEFIFTPARPIKFQPGQYLEWTLPHSHTDSRGNRRYFTIASSPTESDLRLGVKFYPNGSSFKRTLQSVNTQSKIMAGRLAGSFVLPKNRNQKLVFIAGGIGVTPFRSMIKFLLDTNDKRTITLLYAEKTESELVYTNLLKDAEKKSVLKPVFVLSEQKTLPKGSSFCAGLVDESLIAREVPDFKQRIFYVSGPHPMVAALKTTLIKMDVPRRQIKTDFFPGYV